MCGIVGYSGNREAAPIVLEGLQQLEYRGYDSAGIAVINEEGQIERHRAVGKLSNLLSTIGDLPADGLTSGMTGIGHTRWATHGAVTAENSHPHLNCGKTIAVVHNGIVENHAELREELQLRGHHFESQTDTEVIPHLIEEQLQLGSSFSEACRLAFKQLKGSQAIVVLNKDQPKTLIATRIGDSGGIAVAKRPGEVMVACSGRERRPASSPSTSEPRWRS